MAVKKCPKCGAKLVPDAETGNFVCQHCGFKESIENEIKAEPQAQTTQEIPPQPQFQAQPQPQQVNPGVLFDQNGNPVFVQPLQQQAPSQEDIQEKQKKKRKIGPFVASIITLVLTFVFMGLSILFFLQTFTSAGSSWERFWLFFLYLITGIGFITFIPALGLSIASLCCSIIACKSSSKGIKGVSIAILVLSILAVCATVALPFFMPTFIEAGTGSGSGMSS